MSEPTTAEPAEAVAAMREGLLALRHEHWERAEAALRRAVELGDGWPDAHAYLSGALLAQGKATDALAASEAAMAADPDGFAAQLKSGEISLRLGDPVTAEARFLGALRVATPGSGGETAAIAALRTARVQRRRGIEHSAALPWGTRVIRRFRPQRAASGLSPVGSAAAPGEPTSTDPE